MSYVKNLEMLKVIFRNRSIPVTEPMLQIPHVKMQTHHFTGNLLKTKLFSHYMKSYKIDMNFISH